MIEVRDVKVVDCEVDDERLSSGDESEILSGPVSVTLPVNCSRIVVELYTVIV